MYLILNQLNLKFRNNLLVKKGKYLILRELVRSFYEV